MKNLFNLKDFTVKEIYNILDLTEEFEKGKKVDYKGEKIVANLFFEPSTRTNYSFNVAELKLNCKRINFNAENSSVKKGETLYDTAKTFESFGVAALVIRASEKEYYKHFNGTINIPIINGGDGSGSHPTQSLLDLYTIRKEFGKLEGLKIAIVGDIKNSRVAHTNIEVMKRLGMQVFISGPVEFRESEYEFVELDDVIEDMDIVMLLRVQHERHEGTSSMTAEEYNKQYGLNKERVDKMKKTAIIMHPAPFNRGVEITDDVVECDRSRIFPQITNGVNVRKAVLNMVLGEE